MSEQTETKPKKQLGLWYELKRVESDTSQLEYVEGKGTTLNDSLPKEYEFRIYEKDAVGYSGLCGQFPATKEGYADAIECLNTL